MFSRAAVSGLRKRERRTGRFKFKCANESLSVYSDVSDLRGIKTYPSTTASSLGENSNSFSILTKEFLNRPDDDAAARQRNGRPTGGIRNVTPYPTVRINSVDGNNLAETDDSDERTGGYVYGKPKIPFEAEENAASNPEPTTVQPQTTPRR